MLEPIQLPEYCAATLTEPGRTLSRRTSAGIYRSREKLTTVCEGGAVCEACRRPAPLA